MWVRQVYGPDDRLYRGTLYRPEHRSAKGNPFLTDEEILATVEAGGHAFEQIPTQYDVVNNLLVLTATVNGTGRVKIAALPVWVDAFALGDRRFVNATKRYGKNAPEGYLEVIDEHLMIRYQKAFIRSYNTNTPGGTFSSLRRTLYLVRNDSLIRLTSRQEFMAQFPGKKKSIHQYFRTRHFRYRKANADAFRQLMRNIMPDTSGSPLSLAGDTLLLSAGDHKMVVWEKVSGGVRPSGSVTVFKQLPEDFFRQTDIRAEEEKTNTPEQKSGFLKTDREVNVETVVVGTRTASPSDGEVTLSGYVKRQRDGSPVVGATLYIEELQKGSATDDKGFYRFTLKTGQFTLVIRSLEYAEKKVHLKVYSDDRVNFSLLDKVYSLNEVVIMAEEANKLDRPSFGFERLTPKSIQTVPKMMGEVDIVKTALLLPGVQSVGEGASGFNVRGSPSDQNIFYLDHIPVYNATHLFGMFSAFTPNAIRDFTLYKGSVPARFGGRLSSVFDLRTRSGNRKRFSMRGGISPLTGNLLVEGPLVKDKSSYLAAIRSSYSGWVFKMVRDPTIHNSKADFQDAVINLSTELGESNSLNAVAYASHDDIHLVDLSHYGYRNAGSSLSFRRVIRNRHTWECSAVYSQYQYEEANSAREHAEYLLDYTLNHTELTTSLTLVPNQKHELKAGATGIFYLLNQGRQQPLDAQSLVVPITLGREQGVEAGVFLSDEWKINALITLSGGIRYNMYSYLGPQDVRTYPSGAPMELGTILDTVHYGWGERIATYHAPDVRFSGKYSLSDRVSVKAGFTQLHQYIFMLSNTVAVSPTDKWKLVDAHIKPMAGKQYSTGVFFDPPDAKFDVSGEFYIKRADNVVAFKDGANVTVTRTPEVDLLQGALQAYGVECMFRKTAGRMTGWFSYTYSRSKMRINGGTEETSINLGEPFPADFDKPHAVNLATGYRFSRRFNISWNVVYATGRPTTYPTGIFYQHEIPVTQYSERNAYRIPDYFRVDLAVDVEGNLKAKKFMHGSWSFSVYNLLGRHNAYSVFFKQNQGLIQGYKLAVIGSPVFSFTYNFKLGNYED